MADSAGGGSLRHVRLHEKREPQGAFTASRIFGPDTSATIDPTGILSDPGSAQSAFTTIFQTQIIPISQPASTFTTTIVAGIPITNSAQLSQYLTATSTTATATSSPSSTASATHKASSTADKSSSSNNLSTLIPAIVVPVAVVLLASFGLFWWWMRRRAQKQAQNVPEFVMASKPEKQLSRGNSNSSGTSSTRELVPMSKLEKETAISTREIRRASTEIFPPTYASNTIGTARPMTPPDGRSDANKSSGRAAVPNFSSPRPSTSHRRQASRDQESNRNRSQSASTPRSIPAPNGRQSPYNQNRRGPPPNSGNRPPRGPSRGAPHGPPSNAKPTSPDRPPRPRPEDIPPLVGGRSGGRSLPGSISTNLSMRAPPPHPLSPPTPTGAFNGSSPISQYSPIVKDTPNLGALAAPNSLHTYNDNFSSNQNQELSTSHGAGSPTDENILSKENMRIARLANSSRLGFNSNSPIDKDPSPLANAASGNGSRLDTLTSPRLPPPVGRDLNPPSKPFAASLAPSSTYSSPHIGSNSPSLIGTAISDPNLDLNFDSFSNGQSAGRHTPKSIQPPPPLHLHNMDRSSSPAQHNRGISMISRLSSDDGYADMEVPQSPKSDVSSLNDDEKWEMAAERIGTNHTNAGLQGLAATGRLNTAVARHDGDSDLVSPSSATDRAQDNSKYRDRDSEGPFVLSRY